MYLSQYTTLLRRHEFITNNPYQVVVGFIYSTTTLPWSTNFKVRRRSGLSTQQVHFMTGGRAIVGGRQVAYQKSTTYNAHFLQQSRKWNNNFQIFYFTCRCSEILVPTSNVELIYPRCMCVYAFHYYYCHTHRLPWTFIYYSLRSMLACLADLLYPRKQRHLRGCIYTMLDPWWLVVLF